MAHNSEDLKLRLKNLRRENADHRWFIPQLSLRDTLSKNALWEALKAADVDPNHLDEIAECIFASGINIFAVLLLTDQVGCVSKFIEMGELYDQKLPFSLGFLEQRPWIPSAKDFFERQWEVAVPVFSRGTINKCLDERSIIPFIRDKKIDKGGFGTVYEIELDHDHQQLDGIFPSRLVRKELNDSKEHQIELKNLSILVHLKHPNILELLASYTHKDRHNLIFPRAEGGTLANILACDRQGTSFESNESFVIALVGLSSAVEHVHNFVERRLDLDLIGCHHDLKPKNILVSENKWILADFGLSKFRPLSEGSGSMFGKGADSYLAPECEDLDGSFRKHVIRRSSDIWSFGCIITEVVSYMILGPDGVKTFNKQRGFDKRQWHFALFHCGPGQPNPAVNSWLSSLEVEAPKTCKALLKLARAMLSLDEKERPKAKEVTARLQLIAVRAVIESIDEILVKAFSQGNSFDAFIEQKRFEAWKYSLGMLETDTSPDAIGDIPSEQTFAFESILGCLFDIRSYVESLPSQEQSGRVLPLGQLNDRLGELLGGVLQEKARSYFKEAMVERVDNDLLSKIGDNLYLDKEIKARATLKHMTHLVMANDKTGGEEKLIKLPEIGPRFGHHNLASLQENGVSRQVLVEWRSYGRKRADDTINHQLFGRVNAIADLLGRDKPVEFRALDCAGFFHDPSKLAFGLVYDFPRSPWQDRPNLAPETLEKLIAKPLESVLDRPALDDKLKLAHTLARCVLEFHSVGWLHKALVSSNVAFFNVGGRQQNEWLQEPYVLGFHHSRPDEISAFTQGLTELYANAKVYQHPEYLKDSRRYRIEYDYYSLGILLLEIGLWRPIGELSKKYTGTFEENRRNILRERVPLLKEYMGKRYFEAVRTCLEEDFGELDHGAGQANDTKSVHLRFDRLVVSRLKPPY